MIEVLFYFQWKKKKRHIFMFLWVNSIYQKGYF